MINMLMLFSMGAAFAGLAVGFGGQGYWQPLPLLFLMGVAWALWARGERIWIASLGLVFFTLMAILGLLLDLSPGWMLLGLIGALTAWDLSYFSHRMESVGRVTAEEHLIRSHLRHLFWVDLSGILITILALQITVEFSFSIALLLAVIAILGLSRSISFLRSEND